jgi:hypothetical protein
MMTKAEALSFKAGWRLANERIAEEIRSTSMTAKLSQLAVMFAAGEALGWSERMRDGEAAIRERWQRLREKMNDGTQNR